MKLFKAFFLVIFERKTGASMPFIAKSSRTGERIDITQYDGLHVRQMISPDEPVCQLCGEPLIIRSAHSRRGYGVSAHFAHKSDCNAQYDAHPESPEHLYGKAWLRAHLRELYDFTDNLQIDLEVPVQMDWRARGRVIDVMVTWPLGWREAHEVQLAAITPEQLEERSNDYLRSGIDVYWWLGNRAATSANIEYCARRFGECYQIYITGERENV